MNEYDRIQGIVSGYADRFAGQHDLRKLRNRQNELNMLFKHSHENHHPIQDAPSHHLNHLLNIVYHLVS